MGYIFDALNRPDAAGPNRPKAAAPTPPVPSPSESAKADERPGESALSETRQSGSLPKANRRAAEGATDYPKPSITREQVSAVSPSPSASHISESPSPSPSAPPPTLTLVSSEIDPPKFDAGSMDERLVAVTDPASAPSEEYRAIRTGILARWQQRRHLVHTITSATSGEGKTITSLNLGLIFSELNNRTAIVVEADLRQPRFADLLNLDAGPGLSEILHGQASLTQATRKLGTHGPDILSAGQSVQGQEVSTLSLPAMADLVKNLRQRYDHVIIDTPPTVDLADAGIVGALSDEVLLVVRLGSTSKTLIQQAIRTMAGYNAPVAGLIATDRQRTAPSYQSRYFHRESERRLFRQAA